MNILKLFQMNKFYLLLGLLITASLTTGCQENGYDGDDYNDDMAEYGGELKKALQEYTNSLTLEELEQEAESHNRNSLAFAEQNIKLSVLLSEGDNSAIGDIETMNYDQKVTLLTELGRLDSISVEITKDLLAEVELTKNMLETLNDISPQERQDYEKRIAAEQQDISNVVTDLFTPLIVFNSKTGGVDFLDPKQLLENSKSSRSNRQVLKL